MSGACGGSGRAVASALNVRKECRPFGVDRGGISFVAGIEVLDVVGIAAVEKRRAGEGSIGVLTRHAQVLWLGARWRLAKRRPGTDLVANLHYLCRSRVLAIGNG